MDQYIAVHFNATEEKAAIICALLMAMGYEGNEEKDDETVISIKASLFNEEELKAVMDAQAVAYRLETIEPQNWNAQWESSFEPVTVDDFVSVRASFHENNKDVLHDIIITPKMSFGTGHHATTYLMIELMREIDFAGKTVIDFGTGTAVLAILAEKLGAASVLAIDNDEWSINNSEENIAANNCKHITLQLAHEMLHHKKAAIVLANINLNVIVANLQKITAAVHNDAYVLFSGLMTADEPIIIKHLKEQHFQINKIVHRNGWIALLTKPVVFPQD